MFQKACGIIFRERLYLIAKLFVTNNKWNLADEPQDYKYPLAGFYFKGKDEFGFLENYPEVLNEK